MTISAANGNQMQIESPYDVDIHHLSPHPKDASEARKLSELRSILQNSGNESYQRNLKWCSDQQLVRFLIARKFDIKQAYELIVSALEWRCQRKPDEVEQSDGWADRMSKESETGKLYIPGDDQYGRPIIVFDNSVQNTSNGNDHMTVLAWNLELAVRFMAPTTDKYLIFMHLENFSIFNNPTVASTRETIKMLCECYPERLGHLVCYRPPWAFTVVFEAMKSFIDPKTVSKVVFVHGRDEEGTDNDKLMRKVIGPNWKILTGVGQPRVNSKCSPGYNHAVYWPKLVDKVLTHQNKEGASCAHAASLSVPTATSTPSCTSTGSSMSADTKGKATKKE